MLRGRGLKMSVQPTWSRAATPPSMVTRPASSAMYMYQRRSVEDAPSSPAAARSFDAM